jgi:hypothetical protein
MERKPRSLEDSSLPNYWKLDYNRNFMSNIQKIEEGNSKGPLEKRSKERYG